MQLQLNGGNVYFIAYISRKFLLAIFIVKVERNEIFITKKKKYCVNYVYLLFFLLFV